MSRDTKYWSAILAFKKITSVRFKKLITHFKKAESVWGADLTELVKSDLEEIIAREFIAYKEKTDIDQELEKLAAEKIRISAIIDDDYPRLLKKIKNPPYLLYYKGDLQSVDNPLLAVVGTRKTSPYGRQAAYQISSDLVKSGLGIISGLALGIDTISHNAAIESGGTTVAVLGSGLDQQNFYPQSNRALAEKIISSGGAVISEYPPGTEPFHYNFPGRNRIISGLSIGVLIIEAPLKSGALITAEYARDQKRKVFALPGNIYSKNSEGTNDLIKKGGAKLITDYSDILAELNLENAKIREGRVQQVLPLSQNEKMLLKFLSSDPIHIDQLAKHSGMDLSAVSSTLSMLEIGGRVKNLGDMKYVLLY
ncbi:DNA-processing protein DprA [Candidatus Parcubacteria bacterium]|nr:DNA-processing protein DprA [Candidatus Parcubacteria bacterium]